MKTKEKKSQSSKKKSSTKTYDEMLFEYIEKELKGNISNEKR